VYFLSDDERKHVLKGLLPKSRELGVAEELRGWNWPRPPLEPMYPIRLALYEVAGKYCPTGRDLFLRRVQGLKRKPTPPMLAGSAYHDTLVRVLVRAKRYIYEKGVDRYREIFACLREGPAVDPNAWWVREAGDALPEIQARAELIHEFEVDGVAARIRDCLARQPHIGEDSLVALAIPVVLEQKLDGSFLGLSQNLSADALTLSEPMVVDLKFGEPRDFHRLGLAGYGLVMESVYEFPVNLGCLVYASFKQDRLLVRKEFHILDDELRQWLIEERDEKMRMVAEERDPGVSGACHRYCQYRDVCQPGPEKLP